MPARWLRSPWPCPQSSSPFPSIYKGLFIYDNTRLTILKELCLWMHLIQNKSRVSKLSGLTGREWSFWIMWERKLLVYRSFCQLVLKRAAWLMPHSAAVLGRDTVAYSSTTRFVVSTTFSQRGCANAKQEAQCPCPRSCTALCPHLVLFLVLPNSMKSFWKYPCLFLTAENSSWERLWCVPLHS